MSSGGGGHTLCASLAALTGAPIERGNRFRLLRDGEAYFPALLSAVRNACLTISVQVYRFHGGQVATALARALADRARAGVAVRVLFDAFGTGGMDGEIYRLLVAAGVQLRAYQPLRLSTLLRFNCRNHRKIVVLDGAVAFVSGMNFDDVFAGGVGRRGWRDNALEVQGPLVRSLDASVRATWGAGEPDRAASTPAESTARGDDAHGQLFLSAGGRQTLRTVYLHAIAAAHTSVCIASAYLIPEPDLAGALTAAAQRGAEVLLLTSSMEHNNLALARLGSSASYPQLLRAGVRIFEYQPTMLHAKAIIVDRAWCALGSANLDACSLRFNLEAALGTCDPPLVADLASSFEADLSAAVEVTRPAWRRRPFTQRLGGVLARPLRSVL